LLDSPVGDPLTVPNLLLAEAVAADGASVVLNGEGGDPVFGGPKNLPMLVDALHNQHADLAAALAAPSTAYQRANRKCVPDLPVLLTPEALAALDALGPQAAPERFVAPYLAPGRMQSLLNELLHCNLRTRAPTTSSPRSSGSQLRSGSRAGRHCSTDRSSTTRSPSRRD
nr:asparagine synthase-related protein [Micromonospora sp. DSM 115978]